jgi:DNA-binding transcriptional regulator GbsR (MarR family)
MKGYIVPTETPPIDEGPLTQWESLVVEACGNVIEFWGFKRNQGRVWALLYLRDRALTSADLQGELGLSKGAVSMLSRELEGWGVLRRVRGAGESVWRFEAQTDLMKMIAGVIAQRETALIGRVKADLDEAYRLAKAGHAPAAVRERIERIRTLAGLVDNAVKLFTQTARLDVTKAVSVLADVRRKRRDK